MTTFLIPLKNVPQSFEITLSGVNYRMVSRWNPADDAGWVLDFINADTGVTIATNIPLITGADCLSGLEYLGFNGQLAVFTDGAQFAVPTLDNLGAESNLYFLTSVANG